MPTPTRPTATTDRPARVRLSQKQTLIYEELLGEERHALVVERADLKGRGLTGEVTVLNRAIEEIERMQEELRRAQEERGWRA
jgi:hypothetical protein